MYDYQLRYSKRAKHLQMRISHRGLEVIVPAKKKFARETIEQFILEKEHWIKRNWERFSHLQAIENNTPTLPNMIDLQAIGQIWQVKYYQTERSKLSLHANESRQITLMGNISNEKLCLKKLREWLMGIAAFHFEKQLQLLSLETGLSYDKLTIRNNSTRWGSCSSQKNISLCCKLLFLPSVLARHIMVHELCHTKAMHHGRNFWRLFEKFDPHAREHAKALNVASKQIPLWISL